MQRKISAVHCLTEKDSCNQELSTAVSSINLSVNSLNSCTPQRDMIPSVCEWQLNVRSTGQQLLHATKHHVCWLHVSLWSAGELYGCYHLQHYVLHVVNDGQAMQGN